MDTVDSRLELLDENEHLEAQGDICTAMLCLQYSNDLRPTMARVVSMLQGDLTSVVAVVESAQATHHGRLYAGSTSFEISQLSLETIREGETARLNGGSPSSTVVD